MNKLVVISVSGGMDSTSLLLSLLTRGYDEITAFSFDYGQKHLIELERLDQNLKYLRENGHPINHHRIDLRSAMGTLQSSLTLESEAVPEGHYASDNMKATVVPNRNAIFSSIIYAQAQSLADQTGEAVDIALGVHSGDHAIYPDCHPAFYSMIEAAFKLGNWNSEKVNFYLPYLDTDKVGILKDALKSCNQLKLSFDIVLGNTNTSYTPDEFGRASGKTGSDVERILAFNEIGRIDPVEYVDGWDEALAYALEQEQQYKEGNA
jgi:7-cyano-7-deazaguanine synthase